MRLAIPAATVALVLVATATFANPVSTTVGPMIASDTVAGVATFTMGAMRGAGELEDLVLQVRVGDAWEPLPGRWTASGAPMKADGGSGQMEYSPFAYAVPLRDGPMEVRLAVVPSGFRWTGERLEPTTPDAKQPPEWRRFYGRGGNDPVSLPARGRPKPTSSSLLLPPTPPQAAGGVAVLVGAVLLVLGAGRRRDPALGAQTG